jgi:hypothetical protein
MFNGPKMMTMKALAANATGLNRHALSAQQIIPYGADWQAKARHFRTYAETLLSEPQ